MWELGEGDLPQLPDHMLMGSSSVHIPLADLRVIPVFPAQRNSSLQIVDPLLSDTRAEPTVYLSWSSVLRKAGSQQVNLLLFTAMRYQLINPFHRTGDWQVVREQL